MQLYHILLTFTFCLFTFSLSIAQWSAATDSSLWPTSPDSGLIIAYGHSPQIVSDGDGGAIVPFQSQNFVKLKRVDKWGWLQWNGWSGVVAGGIGDAQFLNDVDEDGNGGAFVIFSDLECYSNCGTPFEEASYFVTVQRIDHYGNKLWGDGIRVTTLDTVIQGESQVFADKHGGCIVGWLDYRHQNDPYQTTGDIYVQRLDSLGNRCWGDSALRLTTQPNSYGISIMMTNKNGETFISFAGKMQKLDLNGNKLWGEEGLSADFIPNQVITPNVQGGWTIAGMWYVNNNYRLICQNLDSSGQRMWGYEGITLADSLSYNFSHSRATGISYDNSGNVIISYFFARSGEQPNTYLQKLTPQGIKLFGEEGFPVSNYPSNKRGSIFPSQGDIFALWYDINRQAYYIQKLDYDGNILWNQDTLFSTDGGGPVTNDGSGGLIMVYEKIDFSINLKKISKNGILGEVILTSIKKDNRKRLPEKFILYQNYPNPFNSSTTIPYHLNIPGDVELSIYDITGRELLRIVKKKQQPGSDTVRLDMSDYSSGLYLYQLRVGKNSQTKKFLFIQ